MTDGPSGLAKRLAKRLGSGSGPLWLGNAGTLALRFIQSVIIARAAGAHEFGLYVIVVALSAIFIRLLDLGITSSMAFILRGAPSAARPYAGTILLHCLVAIPVSWLLWVLADASSELDGMPSGLAAGSIALLTAFTVIQLLNSLMLPALIPLGQLKGYAIGSTLTPIFAILATGATALVSDIRAPQLIVIGLISEGLAGLLGLGLLLRTRGGGERPRPEGLVRPLYAYGLKAYVGQALKAVSQRGDRVALAAFLNAGALGNYGVAQNLRDQAATPISIQSLVFRNSLIDLKADPARAGEARRFFFRTLLKWLGVVGPCSLVAAGGAVLLVPLLYGPSFHDTGAATGITMLSLPFLLISAFAWCAILADNRPGLYSAVTILTTVLTVGGAIAGASIGGGSRSAAVGVVCGGAVSAMAWLAAAAWCLSARAQDKMPSEP